MGLLSTNHYHSIDSRTSINYPDTVHVHEHKAPTDESIRLMEEFHEKAVKNIIAKVKVEDNLVNGECFLVEQPCNLKDVKLYFKFKINGKEFTLEKELSRYEIGLEEGKEIHNVLVNLENNAKAIMLWYALRMFQSIMYENIVGHKFPEYLLK